MKQIKMRNAILIVLMSVMIFTLPVFAENGNSETGTVIVPSAEGQTKVTVPYIYVTGPRNPGLLVSAINQSVMAEVSGDVDAVYGGADLETTEGGLVNMKAGRIRGGFGVLAYINGGRIEGVADSVMSSGDTALEAVLGGSGSLNFTANTISSDADAITVAAGVDFSTHIIDTDEMEVPDDPGEDNWDEIDDWDDVDGWEEFADAAGKTVYSDENEPSGKELPGIVYEGTLNNRFSETFAAKAEGDADIVITADSIDAGGTAVDISLYDDRSAAVKAEEIISDGAGALIYLSEKGGDVTLTAPFIDAGEQALLIDASAGTVTVNNEGYIDARSAAEVYNHGAEVKLDAGFILGEAGLYVDSTAGTTTENTEDIFADIYGIYIRTHDLTEDVSFESDEGSAEAESSISQKGKPAVSVTVDGSISDDFSFPEEPEDDYILPPEQSASKGISKDGEETLSGVSDNSTGVIVEAGTAGTVDIKINGEVFMAYGNEIDADNGAAVTVDIRDDVITSYGNRLSADDAEAVFHVGGTIDAGGRALDTLASNDGKLEIKIGEDILVSDADSEEEASGIFANSMGNGSTQIDVSGGISVYSGNSGGAYGIVTDNTGGEISISVGKDVSAEGNGAMGLAVISGSDSDFSETGTDEDVSAQTNVTIHGDLIGNNIGFYADIYGSTGADVFVEGTVSGAGAGVEVSDEVTPDNLQLTAWKIVMKSGRAVTGGIHSKDVEDNINYLIRYAPDDLEGRVEAVDENGTRLPSRYGYQYAKDGDKVYFLPADSDIPGIYNGAKALTKEADGRFSLVIPTGGGIMLASGPAPEPVNPPEPGTFYPIGDLSWLYDRELPGTGFSADHVTPLASRPRNTDYAPTGLTLQLPEFDVAEMIVTVPEIDGGYPVEWLGNAIGLLEQSSLPGEGITVLTGHNHLNTAESGPFLFIGNMEEGDRIMITDEENDMTIYRVYGNYKIAADAFASLAGELREKSLVLITCEDESIDGGYLNRRIIFAEPVG